MARGADDLAIFQRCGMSVRDGYGGRDQAGVVTTRFRLAPTLVATLTQRLGITALEYEVTGGWCRIDVAGLAGRLAPVWADGVFSN